MIVIKTIPYYNFPSYQAIYEFESSFPSNTEFVSEIKNRVLIKILRDSLINYPKFYSKLNFLKKNDDLFTIIMNFNTISKIIPYYMTYENLHLYVYDLWSYDFDKFKNILNNIKIKNIFFSSLHTKCHFENTFNGYTKFHWLPEAVKSEEYSFESYDKKEIDIISFGRRYEEYHKKISPYVFDYKYIYKKGENQLFESHKDLAKSLAKSKISICFPYDVTHPQKAEGISKVTMRYFQSMVSKCLIVGKTPEDLKKLFDYNPVIEFDENNPGEQIIDILNNYKNYIPLIEKNYQEVITKHQYVNRVSEINKIISGIR